MTNEIMKFVSLKTGRRSCCKIRNKPMTKIPSQYKSLKNLGVVSWERIFDQWRRGEQWQKMWQNHWRERGFDSWDEWRTNYIAPLRPEQRRWNLYRIDDLAEVTEFYGVPSRAWIEKCYNGEMTMKLADIVNHPIVTDNEKIHSIRQNFPLSTMLTGVINNDRIVLVEGMHRACALTLSARRQSLPIAAVTVALTVAEDKLPKLGKGEGK